jgi:tRNA(Ile)-lysidine synthase
MIQKIQSLLAAYSVDLKGKKIIIGLSGGKDSVVLLHLLLDHQKQLGFLNLVAIHLNHDLRGAESDADEKFCKELCDQYQVQLVSLKKKPDIDVIQNSGLEQAARELRYNFFESQTKTLGADYVLTAHHKDDQAETIMMRLARGTGYKGLGGVRFLRTPYLRPMLGVDREEITNYAIMHKLNWREDSSNQNQNLLRNRYRLSVLPGDDYKRVRELCTKIAFLVHQTEDKVLDTAQRIFEKCVLESSLDALVLNRPLLKIHVEDGELLFVFLAESLLHTNLPKLNGPFFIRFCEELQKGKPNVAIPFSMGWQAVFSPFEIRLERATTFEPFCFAFCPKSGATYKWKSGLKSYLLQCTIRPLDIAKTMPAATDFCTLMDAGSLPQNLFLRTPQLGDIFNPLGLHTKKRLLSKFFKDCQLPVQKRESIPLIATEHEVLWVPGLRLSERCRIQKNTTEILEIRLICQSQIS